jgi:hypothetical protein
MISNRLLTAGLRPGALALHLGFALTACGDDASSEPVSAPVHDAGPDIEVPAHPHADISRGLTFVDYRSLQGGEDGVLLLDLDPESEAFGTILDRLALGTGVVPHHLYFNQEQDRLYTSALGGPFLYEIKLQTDEHGVPSFERAEVIDTGDNQVGEDIYFTEDGSTFFMTFLTGHGGDRGGSVGVFDAVSHELMDDIVAPESAGAPFILYPHGISANEELGLMMVTSDAHPDGVSGVGNTVTLIDIETREPLDTYLVADDTSDLTETVEVLMLRDDLPPYTLVSTVSDASIWVSGYDENTERFGTFERRFDGRDEGLGVALEFYIHARPGGEQELYVSFAHPGAVLVFGLDELPRLPLRRTIEAAPGAHHMVFFETRSGRDAIVIQNNLINIDGLNEGTLTVHDTLTGELIGEVDLPATEQLLPESIESAFGHGHDIHH